MAKRRKKAPVNFPEIVARLLKLERGKKQIDRGQMLEVLSRLAKMMHKDYRIAVALLKTGERRS